MVGRSISGFNPSLSLSKFFLESDSITPFPPPTFCGNQKHSYNNPATCSQVSLPDALASWCLGFVLFTTCRFCLPRGAVRTLLGAQHSCRGHARTSRGEANSWRSHLVSSRGMSPTSWNTFGDSFPAASGPATHLGLTLSCKAGAQDVHGMHGEGGCAGRQAAAHEVH